MKKILLIDDEMQLRSNVSEMLTIEGYEVITANDGLDGLAKAINEYPDLILCDLMMPRIDGYTVLNELRKTSLVEIPFIFLSAKSDCADVRKGMDLGADDYLIKPFSRLELLQSVEVRLSKRKHVDELVKAKSADDRMRVISYFNSHDIRTFLNIIIGMSSVLSSTIEQNEDAERIVTYILNSGWNIVRFINNVYYNELLNLNEKNTAVGVSNLASAKKTVEDISRKLTQEYGRDGDIKLVLENIEIPIEEKTFLYLAEELMYNAFKFTEKGCTIEINLFELKGSSVIKIKDFGPGFILTSMDEIQPYRKFSPFKALPGLGLGLSNAKRIIENLHGQFLIETKPNDGTTITIIFKKNNPINS
jgi:two-component system, sensor histidine kinase and response regulator